MDFTGNPSRGRKAIFFTIDALLALLIGGAMIFSIFSALSRLSSGQSGSAGTYVSELGESALSSLDNSGTLLLAVSNSSAIYSEMELAPPSVCWEISLIREDGVVLSSAKKGGCSCREVSIARRPIVSENSTFKTYSIAEGRFCLK